jgi:hypothetical protein
MGPRFNAKKISATTMLGNFLRQPGCLGVEIRSFARSGGPEFAFIGKRSDILKIAGIKLLR